MNSHLPIVRRFLSVLVGLSLLLASLGTAYAEEPTKFEDLSAAQKRSLANLVDEAKTAYNRGDFEDSLRKFQSAYDIYAHPDMLYRMGLCYERLNEYQAAVDHYEAFLAKVPDAPERQRIEKIIESLSARVTRATIGVSTVPAGASVFINDISNASGTTPTEFPIAPGTHVVIVRQDGYDPIEEQVTVEAGQSLQLRYQLTPSLETTNDSSAVESNPPNPNLTKVALLSAVGVGSTITSIVFFSLYADRREELNSLESRDRQDVSRQRIDETRSSMYTQLGLGISMAAVASGALIWAYLSWKDGEETRARQAVAPTFLIGPEGWRAGWTLSF